MKSLRENRRRWVSAAGAIVISLVSVEAYLRIQYWREHQKLAAEDPNREFCTMRAENPRLIYSYVPSRPGCETNAHGYRDHEHPYDKSSDVFRVVIIGDSIAEGWGVPLEATFARVTERLAPKRLSRRLEAVILARQGYSTSQELALLQDEALNYHPDLIIWSYALNDPADPIFHNANSDTGRYFFRPRIFLIHFLRQTAFNIREQIKGKSCDPEYHAFLHCVYWGEVEEHLDEIGQISRRSGIPILFLIHPVFESAPFDQYSLAPLHHRLAELAARDGLLPLDGTDCYRGHSPEELRLHREVYDPWHPNAMGHELLGRCLVDAIAGSKG